jgi:hypothetical protein
MGLTRFSFVRAMTFRSTTKFLSGSRWVPRSLPFVADKFGDLSLQELESCEVVRSSTDRLPLALVRVSLINEAQLRRRSISLGKTDSDPSRDKADHTLAITTAIIDPIYQSPPESDFEGNREVFMVGDGEQPRNKTIEEIAREAEDEIAEAAHLARTGKRHNRYKKRYHFCRPD